MLLFFCCCCCFVLFCFVNFLFTVCLCSGLFAAVAGEHVSSCTPAVTGHVEGIITNHLTAPVVQLSGSHGVKSHNTALVLIPDICTVIKSHAHAHTFLPNKQAEVDTTFSNSSPQALPCPARNLILPPGFFRGHVCQSRQLVTPFS